MSFIHTVVDKVYVINLDKDTKRLKNVQSELQKHYITFERFPAIVGKNLTHSRHLTEFCNIYCTDGMKGCALSHRTIWEECVQKGYKAVLVLEDDITLHPEFNSLLQSAWDKVPSDFDIVYLGCNGACEVSDTPVNTFIQTVTNNKPVEVNERVFQNKGGIGLYGYIISRRCAEQLLQHQIVTHVDSQIRLWARELELSIYSLHPKLVLVKEEKGGSNLSDAFPPLLNTILSTIQITDNISLGWGLSENFMKLAGWNINLILLLSCIFLLFLPTPFAYLFFLWIGAEWTVSKDTSNTIKYIVFFIGALLLKYIVGVNLYWVSNRVTKSVLRIGKRFR